MSAANEGQFSESSRKKSGAKKLIILLTVLILIGGILITSVIQLIPQAKRAIAMKNSLQNLISCVMGQNPDGAQYSLEEIKATTAEIRESLNSPFWKFASHVPTMGNEFRTIQELLNILDSVADELIQPGIVTLRENPLGTGENMDAQAMLNYLDYIGTALPKINELVTTANSLDLGLLDVGGKVSELLDSANQFTAVANRCGAEMLPSVTQLMRDYPLSTVKQGDKYNIRTLSKYLDFFQTNLPQIRGALTELKNGGALDLIAGSEKFGKYLELAEYALNLYDENPDLVTMMNTAIGSGEDKCYLLVAMNSTEVRALGGFPGSVGVVRIKDGLLTIGDFQSVYNLFPGSVPYTAGLTQEEINLFNSSVGGITRTWDACLCPDFPRVAEIWAASYASMNGYPVDGIAALTPTVIQKVLAITGGGITLSDGTWLDGTNATRTLERDIYFRYFGRETYTESSNYITDNLFAETARFTMESAVKSLSKDTIPAFLDMAEECFRERTAMVWMRDDTCQQLIRQRGWDGGLSDDPMVPEAGIYFNVTIASKMGWFAQIDTEVGEPTVNADNSRTYPMTVTLSNTITPEEIAAASNVYILGGGMGSFDCSAYFFAPAGGTVSDFTINIATVVQAKQYKDLPVGYLSYAKLDPGSPIVITYNLTTAPGADAPLTISQTPTLQEFH